MILPKKRNYYIETNYSHYIHAHHKEPLDRTREVIAKEYPNYLPAFDKVMGKRGAHMFNMFIMKRNAFESYCSFMFDVLGKLENSINISEYSVQEARVFGYISELLMDVWLYTNLFTHVEISWGQIGGKNTLRKGFSLIKPKTGYKDKNTFLIFIWRHYMSDTAAIVVTYNRKKLLRECIRNLQMQTQKVDIVIIDNMSTDGTAEMLKPFIKNDSIIYHSTGKNIGGAGGFHEGIKFAYKLGYEYFWLMDDDCIPTINALKQLKLADKELNGKYGFICSKVLWTDNHICRMNIPKLSLSKKVSDFNTPIVPIRMGTFVSFLTKRSVVEKVGLPVKEFFIWVMILNIVKEYH